MPLNDWLDCIFKSRLSGTTNKVTVASVHIDMLDYRISSIEYSKLFPGNGKSQEAKNQQQMHQVQAADQTLGNPSASNVLATWLKGQSRSTVWQGDQLIVETLWVSIELTINLQAHYLLLYCPIHEIWIHSLTTTSSLRQSQTCAVKFRSAVKVTKTEPAWYATHAWRDTSGGMLELSCPLRPA